MAYENPFTFFCESPMMDLRARETVRTRESDMEHHIGYNFSTVGKYAGSWLVTYRPEGCRSEHWIVEHEPSSEDMAAIVLEIAARDGIVAFDALEPAYQLEAWYEAAWDDGETLGVYRSWEEAEAACEAEFEYRGWAPWAGYHLEIIEHVGPAHEVCDEAFSRGGCEPCAECKAQHELHLPERCPTCGDASPRHNRDFCAMHYGLMLSLAAPLVPFHARKRD